jgi:hypothetical protein
MSTNAVRQWLYETLNADGALMDLVHAIYDGKAPEGAPFDYIVLGGTSDGDAPGWMGVGASDGGEDIRIHTRPDDLERPGERKARAIYDELKRILHRVDASVDGALLWNSRLTLPTVFIEPDGITTTAPARYTFQIAQAA